MANEFTAELTQDEINNTGTALLAAKSNGLKVVSAGMTEEELSAPRKYSFLDLLTDENRREYLASSK